MGEGEAGAAAGMLCSAGVKVTSSIEEGDARSITLTRGDMGYRPDYGWLPWPTGLVQLLMGSVSDAVRPACWLLCIDCPGRSALGSREGRLGLVFPNVKGPFSHVR